MKNLTRLTFFIFSILISNTVLAADFIPCGDHPREMEKENTVWEEILRFDFSSTFLTKEAIICASFRKDNEKQLSVLVIRDSKNKDYFVFSRENLLRGAVIIDNSKGKYPVIKKQKLVKLTLFEDIKDDEQKTDYKIDLTFIRNLAGWGQNDYRKVSFGGLLDHNSGEMKLNYRGGELTKAVLRLGFFLSVKKVRLEYVSKTTNLELDARKLEKIPNL